MRRIRDILKKYGVKQDTTIEGLLNLFQGDKSNMRRKKYLDLLDELIFPDSPLIGMIHPGTTFTALHLASSTLQMSEVVDKLISCGANVNAQDVNGRTPLSWAIDSLMIFLCGQTSFIKKSETIKVLIKNKADIHILNNEGTSVLHKALSTAFLEFVEILLINCNFPPANPRWKQHIALEKRRKKCRIIIKCLIQQSNMCIDPHTKFSLLLQFIVLQKDQNLDDLFEYTVKNTFFDVNALNLMQETLLHIVSKNGTPAMIDALIAKGADIQMENSKHFTALDVACKFGNLDIVELLLSRGAEVNMTGFTTLHHAITGGDPTIVKIIVQEGVDVNYECHDVGTPLQYAIKELKWNYVEIVQILLEFNADANLADKSINSPLHLACLSDKPDKMKFEEFCRNPGIINELLNSKADINALDKSGRTPLYYAHYNYTLLCNSDRSNSKIPYERDLETLVAYLIERRERKEFVCAENILLLETEAISQIYEKCQDEIESMKEKVLNSLHISYLNILLKNAIYLWGFLRNDGVMEVLNSFEYKNKFPHYGLKLEKKIQEGKQRESLMVLMGRCFFKYIAKMKFPLGVTFKICEHLSLKDLKHTAEACLF